MRKIRIIFTLVVAFALGFTLLSGGQPINLEAAVPTNVGVIDGTAPDWVQGHEASVQQKFADAYTDADFTETPDDFVNSVSFGAHKRVALIQKIGSEGAILLNEIDGTPFVITDEDALTELEFLLVQASNNENGILMDIVESSGSTYYVTDRRNLDGIFRLVEDPLNPGTFTPEYLNLRVGIGKGTYADIMWIEYTKAYKLAAQFMEPLGLPLTAVARYRYTTPNLNNNGTYVLDNGNKVLSEKDYTKQQFENGWIIQARMQILTNSETGALGGHQAVSHAAAPIMNDMYTLVTAMAGNSDLSVTGAPVSLEFNVEGVRYQNFEYGHVKVESGVATFVPDLVVDSLGTAMNRRIGITLTWDNIRTGHADNNPVHGLGWERLRVSQNYRDTVGELIRDGILPGPLADNQIVHSGEKAPADGTWFSFNVGKNPDGTNATSLGAANFFIYHTSWYKDAYPLLPYLNTAQFVDAADGLGRPIDVYKNIYNVYYQEFKGGIGYRDMKPGSTPVRVLAVDMPTWLDGAESIEAALLAKGIAKATHTVTFNDHDGTEISTVNVAHGTAAVAPDAPERAGYLFDKWSVAFDNVLSDITVTAQYKAIEYDVTYVLDGGINDVSNPTVGTVESNVELQPATKEGFFFLGWFAEPDFTTQVTYLENITAPTTLYARFTETMTAEAMVGEISGTAPAWAKGHEAVIKTEFMRVYTEELFTAIPNEFVKSIDLGNAQVLLYQIIPGEGAIVLNEATGKAFFTKNLDAVNAYLATLGTENASLLLDIITVGTVEYFITDKSIFSFDSLGALVPYANTVGVGGTYVVGSNRQIEFTKAYQAAANLMESLGLPISVLEEKTYNTLTLNGNGTYVDGTTRADRTFLIQAFANGYIIQGQQEVNVQHGAAPILLDMYNLVVSLLDNATLNETGAPVSVEFTVNGIRYQNFEYGYVKVENGVATFVKDLVVDNTGFEMNRRIGSGESFANWDRPTNRNEYQIIFERLRVGQNFRNTIGEIIRSTEGRPIAERPYVADITENNSQAMHWVIHEFDKIGVVHMSERGDGTSMGGRKTFVTQGYWYNDVYMIAYPFNAPGLEKRSDLGRPVTTELELYNVTYQVYEKGILYIDGKTSNPSWTMVAGTEFATWMGSRTTVEEALEAKGIAEAKHTVTWYERDGITILKTEEVNHGDPATPPTPPEIDGLVFSHWSPEDYSSILLPDMKFVAIYGSETGLPQEGKYKFINFDSDGETASFWYENETNIIEVNATLFNAFRASKLTMAESIAVNGLPIYADDNNLITTLFHFQIDELDNTVVNKLNTIGYLNETVTELQNVNVKVALDQAKKLIIQDSFGDAYIFTWDRGGHLLGLPLGVATIERLYPNTANQDEFIDIIVQEFEHGFIMQEAYDNAAYSIYGKSYDEWLTLGGLNGNDSLGVPTSRPYEHEGIIYQNFKYGYIMIDGETVTPTYTESVQLDFKGRPIDKRAGRAENRENVKKGHVDFEGEILRIYESYMQLYTDMKDQGLMFDHAIEWVHEWNGYGLTQGFNPSLSTANVWGQANFTHVDMETPYTDVYLIKDDILVQYALLDGNKTFGFPTSNSFKVDITVEHEGEDVELSVTFQNFTAGYIRTYLVGDIYVLEYFRDAEISDLGVHMVDGVAADTPEWDLSGLTEGPGIDKAELQNKLAALEAERAKVKELVGDIKDLPSNQLFASKALLDEVDAKILEIEALIADEDATNAEITQALVELDALLTKLKNQSAPGQGDPVTEPGEGDGFPTWAIVVLSIVGGLIVLGAAGFVVYTFVIKKKK